MTREVSVLRGTGVDGTKSPPPALRHSHDCHKVTGMSGESQDSEFSPGRCGWLLVEDSVYRHMASLVYVYRS